MADKPVFTSIYDLDYFTDAQMFLYIGDVWVDEVTSLQFGIQQQKTPIYGYASQLFDTTAAGHVIVGGSFSINFKEAGYLWAVLRRWFDYGPGNPDFLKESHGQSSIKDPVDKNLTSKLTRNKANEGKYSKGSRPVVGSNGTLVSRASIERLVQGKISKSERSKFYHDLSGYATFNTKSPKDKTFEDICEAFEDEVWKTTDNDSLLNQVRRTDDNVFDGFDIYAVFGNYAVPGANHTVQKIVGVRLTGMSKVVQIGGGPIQEQYEFLAQTIV